MYLQRDYFAAMVALCLHTVMRAPTGSAPQKYNSACFDIMFLPQFSFYCTVQTQRLKLRDSSSIHAAWETTAQVKRQRL